MAMKELLMMFGIEESEAERLVEENLPQLQANVAYHQNMADLARFESASDLDPS